MMNSEKEVTFPVGTVVLQAVNDDERCVGVVVGSHMIDRLDANHREIFEKHLANDDYHILLVLSYFRTYDDRWSSFSKSKGFQFPSYIAIDIRTATKADLSNEMALMLRHKEEKPSRGLCYGRLHAAMFGFSNKQIEALELVLLADHYMKGGNEWTAPEILRHSFLVTDVLAELSIACPRS